MLGRSILYQLYHVFKNTCIYKHENWKQLVLFFATIWFLLSLLFVSLVVSKQTLIESDLNFRLCMYVRAHEPTPCVHSNKTFNYFVFQPCIPVPHVFCE